MKVRFVGGPFGGQVKNIDRATYGRDEIVMRGPKKMSRKQKYEHMALTRTPFQYAGHTPDGSPVSMAHYGAFPIVTARYRLAMRAHSTGQGVHLLACMHPDGSLFYEFIEGSKREI